jgi:hypothetical protein
VRSAGPRWYLRDRLGERRTLTGGVTAAPTPLCPRQRCPVPRHRQVPRPGTHPRMRILRPLPAPRAASPLTGSRHHRDQRIALRIEPDRNGLHPVQAQQPCRTVDQARGSLTITLVSATRIITERHGRYYFSKTLIYRTSAPLNPKHGQARRAIIARCRELLSFRFRSVQPEEDGPLPANFLFASMPCVLVGTSVEVLMLWVSIWRRWVRRCGRLAGGRGR